MKSALRLSDAVEARLQHIMQQYPERRSALMPALYLAQEALGVLNDQAITWVAERIGIAPIQVQEVASFYTMFRKRPVGKYHLQVCRTLCCTLAGANQLTAYLSRRLGLQPGAVSADGLWSFEEVECLGSCGSGPLCQINDCFFEKLSPEKLGAILDRIEREQPDLSFSTVRDELGAGLAGQPKSEIQGGPA